MAYRRDLDFERRFNFMSKFRSCSNHSLAIGTGRHRSIQVDNRLCLKRNVIEDEIHFLAKRSLFDTTRQKFLKELVDIDSVFSKLDHDNLFMTGNNCLVIVKLAPYITACFEIRRISLSVISL